MSVLAAHPSINPAKRLRPRREPHQEVLDEVAATAMAIASALARMVAPPRTRRAERSIVALAALFYPADGIPRRGVVCDLSRNGLFLCPSSEPMRLGVGQTVRVVFIITLPGGAERTIDAQAIVRWAGLSHRHRCAGLGLQFAQLPEALLGFCLS